MAIFLAGLPVSAWWGGQIAEFLIWADFLYALQPFATLALFLPMGFAFVANRMMVPVYDEIAPRDPRPPVVYLRPFSADTPKTLDWTPLGSLLIPVPAFNELHLERLKAIGPVVTISEPGASSVLGIYPLGAYRCLCAPGEWQSKVAEMLRIARLVVFTPGPGAGIGWEAEAVRRLVSPQSLLLYLPPRGSFAIATRRRQAREREHHEQYRQLIEAQFPVRLPELWTTVKVMGFTAAWEPILGRCEEKRGWLASSDLQSWQLDCQLRHVAGTMFPEQAEALRGRIAGRAGRYLRNTLIVVFLTAGFAAALLPALR
jgi:hypothetical protein